MYTAVPPRPGAGQGGHDDDGPDADGAWGLRRAVRRAFPDPALLAADPEHSARLEVYLADLLNSYGFEPNAGGPGGPGGPAGGAYDAALGQSYEEMAVSLIASAVPAGESVDLLVLAYAVPDIAPGRASVMYLSEICPGRPLAFAISDQGTAAAFTGLRLIREYARSDGLRRALLLLVEQAAPGYDPALLRDPHRDAGTPISVPDGHSGVALLFGDLQPDELDPHDRDPDDLHPGNPREPDPRNPAARLGAVEMRTTADPDALAAEVDAFRDPARASAVILGASLAKLPSALSDPTRVRVAEAGRPFTGLWWELADELFGESTTGTPSDKSTTDTPSGDDTPARQLVLADFDPDQSCLSLAALDVGTVGGLLSAESTAAAAVP